ncbi:MAG TPA: hypothetical protein VFF06_11645 [Polyangia bacterium]|nr:hypothetical protein [Polyangia bacterium]
MPILFSKVRVVPSTDFGSGGMPFECHAPHPGFALVGLQLRVGDWIDQVTPVFAELDEDGGVGPELFGSSHGGYGGHLRQLRVAPGCVATGLQTRSGSFIDGVRLLQARWDGTSLGESAWTEWVTGASIGGVERPERIVEPYGRSVIVGIAGRAMGYVDNLTVVCAELSRISSTAITAQTSRGHRSASSAHATG